MSGGHPYPRFFQITEAKIVRYLLDPTSADGASKADFLGRFGFSPERPLELMDALGGHPQRERWMRAFEAPHGIKHYFEGPLATPDGRDPLIRTVWQVDYDGDGVTARFITIRPKVQPPHARA